VILIPKTFDDIAIEHYQLPEVRKIVTAYALMQDRTKQALNEDFRETIWFPGLVKEVLSHYEGLGIAVLRTDIKDKAYLFRALLSKAPRQDQMTFNVVRGRS
jgi:hypothetical protein